MTWLRPRPVGARALHTSPRKKLFLIERMSHFKTQGPGRVKAKIAWGTYSRTYRTIHALGKSFRRIRCAWLDSTHWCVESGLDYRICVIPFAEIGLLCFRPDEVLDLSEDEI